MSITGILTLSIGRPQRSEIPSRAGQSGTGLDHAGDFQRASKDGRFPQCPGSYRTREEVNPQCALRQLGHLDSLEDVRKNLDRYDCGIYNADLGVGQIIDKLKELGYYEDTAIIVTADHGEDMGELGRYSEHGCADDPVTRIPFIIKWPGGVGEERRLADFITIWI